MSKSLRLYDVFCKGLIIKNLLFREKLYLLEKAKAVALAKKCRGRDLNPRPSGLQPDALPAELPRHYMIHFTIVINIVVKFIKTLDIIKCFVRVC